MKSNLTKCFFWVLLLFKIDANAQVHLKMPVYDPTVRGTYGDSRFYAGMHKGIDIHAPRETFLIVTEISDSGFRHNPLLRRPLC